MIGPMHPTVLLLVALGGAAGALCRHFMVLIGARLAPILGTPAAFPIGVPAANILGGLAIGFLAVAMTRLGLVDRYWPLVVTGFLGGFTTFSAFSLDTVSLWDRGRADLAFAYVAINVVGAIGAAALGAAAARATVAGSVGG